MAAAWHGPSALAKLSVQGLAGHLAGQIFFIPKVLAEPVPTEEVIGLHEYYARVHWIGSDLDEPFNVLIRTSGEDDAADGPAALAARVEATVASCARSCRPRRPGRCAAPPGVRGRSAWTTSWRAGCWRSSCTATTWRTASASRRPSSRRPPCETVVDILSRIAVRRHGATNVLRALSRAERAPASIAAL